MATIYERLKEYKSFSELSPDAAEKAIRDNKLFTTKTLWGQSMDPKKVNLLFYPDGRSTKMFLLERQLQELPELHVV